jgi:hypothetical protein
MTFGPTDIAPPSRITSSEAGAQSDPNWTQSVDIDDEPLKSTNTPRAIDLTPPVEFYPDGASTMPSKNAIQPKPWGPPYFELGTSAWALWTAPAKVAAVRITASLN